MTSRYVSPGGNDITGDGTQLLPYATITKAHSVAATSGDTIVLMPGIHTYSSTVTLTKGISLISQSGTYIGTSIQFTGGAGISYSDISGFIDNITISNLTFTSTVLVASLITVSFPGSGTTSVNYWPKNIKIFGNKLEGTVDYINFDGENLSVYNNIFERSSVVTSGQVQPIVARFVRGEMIFDGNTITDNYVAPELIYLGSRGSSGTYYNYLNSKDCTITVTNNTVTYTAIGSNITHLVKHEKWNENGFGMTPAEVAAYRVNYYISNNKVYQTNINPTAIKRLRPLVLDATPQNDGTGASVLNQIGFVYFENNVFSTPYGDPAGGTNEGYILIANVGTNPGNQVTPTNINTPTFFFRDNSAGIIPVPFPRAGTSGSIYLTQRNTYISPLAMYDEPWVVTDIFTPPVFDPATYDFFSLPVNMILDISGLTYAPLYRSNANEPDASVTTHTLFDTEATEVIVSNLPADTFKVIVGTAPSVSSNSLWFFIRVYDILGNIITSFPTPITVQITTNTVTGPIATVKLNGSTLTTTATEVSTGVYSFQLLANSEYLIEGFSEPPAPAGPIEDRFSDRSSVEWRQEACILAKRVGRFPDYAAYIRSKRCSRGCC
jgi:hypothetical protein